MTLSLNIRAYYLNHNEHKEAQKRLKLEFI